MLNAYDKVIHSLVYGVSLTADSPADSPSAMTPPPSSHLYTMRLSMPSFEALSRHLHRQSAFHRLFHGARTVDGLNVDDWAFHGLCCIVSTYLFDGPLTQPPR
jgi:hypothetical protein